MNQQDTSLSSNHGNDNTSFIIGINQENKRVTAYISSPPPSPSPPITTQQPSSSSLVTHIIVDDIIGKVDTNRKSIINDSDSDSDSDNGGDIHNNSLVVAKVNKKKSVKSRFNNALKNSKLRLKPSSAGNPPTNFIFSSSSTPIPNSSPLEKRHSTSSTCNNTLIKSHHLQQSHNDKLQSSSTQKSQHCQSPPSFKPATSLQQTMVLHAEEKNNRPPSCSSSSSSSSVASFATHGGSLSSSPASTIDHYETSSSPQYNITTTNDDAPSSPSRQSIADSSTLPPQPLPQPSSRFLAAFQKIRQQRPSPDPSISITTAASRRSLDVSPIPFPSATTVGTGSRSTSFTEKIKIKFKPTTARPSSTIVSPSPPLPPASPVAPTPSHSSTSFIHRSWSPFSRPFAFSASSSSTSSSSRSIKYTHDQPHQTTPRHNEVMEGQAPSGKRIPSSSHHHHHHHHRNRSSRLLSQQQQQQQQRFVAPNATAATSGLRGYHTKPKKTFLTPLDYDKGNGTWGDHSSFETMRGDMIMVSSTCSTSSQRSSMSSLSVTASSYTSASSSPTSLSTDISSHDNNKKPFDISTINNNKSYARSTVPPSYRSLASSPSHFIELPPPTSLSIAEKIHDSNTIHRPSSKPVPPCSLMIPSTIPKFNSTSSSSVRSDRNGIKPAISAARHSNTASLTTKKSKKKQQHHVRFVTTAKVQDTFSKHDYDRASDPYAICTRLTAQLAQQIKDELNAFKLEEMMVHHQSRCNTQFFM